MTQEQATELYNGAAALFSGIRRVKREGAYFDGPGNLTHGPLTGDHARRIRADMIFEQMIFAAENPGWLYHFVEYFPPDIQGAIRREFPEEFPEFPWPEGM